MGALAQNLREIGYSQAVSTPILYAQQVLDHNHNGLISVQEASENPVFSSLVGNLTLVLAQNITTVNGTAEQLNPQYNINNDTSISINDELKPRLLDRLKSLSVVTPGEKCGGLKTCPIWLTSHFSSIPNLDIISKVPSKTSILILQGKNDTDTPIQQAYLLQQKLTELRHPDHTLITYPGPWPFVLSFISMADWHRTNTRICSTNFLAGFQTQSEALRNLPFCDKNEW